MFLPYALYPMDWEPHYVFLQGISTYWNFRNWSKIYPRAFKQKILIKTCYVNQPGLGVEDLFYFAPPSPSYITSLFAQPPPPPNINFLVLKIPYFIHNKLPAPAKKRVDPEKIWHQPTIQPSFIISAQFTFQLDNSARQTLPETKSRRNRGSA